MYVLGLLQEALPCNCDSPKAWGLFPVLPAVIALCAPLHTHPVVIPWQDTGSPPSSYLQWWCPHSQTPCCNGGPGAPGPGTACALVCGHGAELECACLSLRPAPRSPHSLGCCMSCRSCHLPQESGTCARKQHLQPPVICPRHRQAYGHGEPGAPYMSCL